MNVFIIDTKHDKTYFAIGAAAAGRIVGVTGPTIRNWAKKQSAGYFWNRFYLEFNVEIVKPKPRGATMPGAKMDKFNFNKSKK